MKKTMNILDRFKNKPNNDAAREPSHGAVDIALMDRPSEPGGLRGEDSMPASQVTQAMHTSSDSPLAGESSIISEAAPTEVAAEYNDGLRSSNTASEASLGGLPLIGHHSVRDQQRILFGVVSLGCCWSRCWH